MQHLRSHRRAVLWTPLAVAALLAVGSCSDQITMVDVAAVEVSPSSATIRIAESTRLTARLLAPGGQPLSGRPVEWRSLNNAVATVDDDGTVRGVAPGVTTIEAANNGIVGTAAITVSAGPSIAVSPSEIEFTAVRNGSTPGDRSVSVQNAGSGTLGGLTATVRYNAGQPAGWLSVTMGSTAPTNLVLSANQGSLAAGTYTATVDIASPDAPNSPGTVTARLVVLTPQPAIALGATSAAFVASAGGAQPPPQTVAVTNAGGGTLSGLSTSISYTGGQPTGWLSASLSGTTAPATITLQANTTSLAAGSYTATVTLSSGVAQNSPQQIAVTLTVGTAQPAIGVSPASLTFNTQQNATSVTPQVVQVTNAGGGVLSGLTTSVTFPGGQASGWLSVQLSGTSAPATLTIGAHPAGLTPGTYTATVAIASATAANSPRVVDVTLNVAVAPPLIVATPPSATFSSTAAAVNPAPVQIAITNGGGGSLTGLALTITYPAGSSTGWLTAELGSTTAPTSLTLTASRGSLPLGTHTATVRVTATGAAPLDVPVQYTVTGTAPTAPTAASARATGHSTIELTWSGQSPNEDRFEIDRSTDGGGSWPNRFTAPAGTTRFTDVGLVSSTAYTYRVRACNAVGCSDFTASTTAATAPAPPTALTAVAVSPTRIDLAWTDRSSDETAFSIERSTDGGFVWLAIRQTEANATAFSDQQAAAGATFRYRVRACRGGICSGPSNVAEATTPVVPLAPSGLTASASLPTQVNLTWADNSNNESEFRIEARTGGGTYVQVGVVGADQTAFAHTGLTPSTTYQYRVRACSPNACSPYSNEATATTPAAPPAVPAAPTNLSATATAPDRINVSWSAPAGTVTEYRLERRTGAGDYTEIAQLTGTQTSYSDTGLQPSTTYSYRVRAGNVTGLSAYSNVATATTPAAPPAVPAAPTAFSATGTSASTISLSWSHGGEPAATRFEIGRATASAPTSFATIASVDGGARAYNDTGLPASSTFHYRIRACSGDTCSAWTTGATATTHEPTGTPSPPSNVAATAISPTQVLVTWSPATGHTHYEVRRRTGTSGGWESPVAVGGTSSQYLDSSVSAGQTYQYQVRTCAGSSCSDFSGPETVTTPTAG
jgi:fibronectin type 3 domain-containing protein